MMQVSILGRAIAVTVFLRDGGPWRGVAVYEGVCGGFILSNLRDHLQVAKLPHRIIRCLNAQATPLIPAPSDLVLH